MSTLTVTYDNDAWEFFYDVLRDYTVKNLSVRLTLLDGSTVEGLLHSLDGEAMWDPTSEDCVLIVTDLDGLNAREVPLYTGKNDAECNVVGIHVN